MTHDLIELLKKTFKGDETSIQIFFQLFQAQKMSSSLQDEIFQYVKKFDPQNPHIIYLQAIFYDIGFSVQPNVDMAFLFMREAAAKGHAKAIYEVGRRFLEGKGVDKHYENAIQWLKLAAESPNYVGDAMYELGRMHEQGLGTTVDLKRANEWYLKAAEKGHQAAKAKLV